MEIYNWFKKQAATGRNEYVTFAEARALMRKDGITICSRNVNNQIRSMTKRGLLEMRSTDRHTWRVGIRLKENG